MNPARRHLPIASLSALLALSVLPAQAQMRATLAPMNSVLTVPWTTGHHFDYCPGSYGPSTPPDPIPLEWEVRIENGGIAAETVTYDVNVRPAPTAITSR